MKILWVFFPCGLSNGPFRIQEFSEESYTNLTKPVHFSQETHRKREKFPCSRGGLNGRSFEVIEFSGPIFCGCILLQFPRFFSLLISCVLVFHVIQSVQSRTHRPTVHVHRSMNRLATPPHMQVQSAMQIKLPGCQSKHAHPS